MPLLLRPINRLCLAVEAGFLLIALWSAHTSDHMFLPTVSLGAGGLLLAMGEGFSQFQHGALGLIAGQTSLLVISLLYRHFRRREGLGLGDVKPFAAAGAWVKLDGLSPLALCLVYALFILGRALADTGLQKTPLRGRTLRWLLADLDLWAGFRVVPCR